MNELLKSRFSQLVKRENLKYNLEIRFSTHVWNGLSHIVYEHLFSDQTPDAETVVRRCSSK